MSQENKNEKTENKEKRASIRKVDKKEKTKSETNKSKLWGYRAAVIIAIIIIIILLLFKSCVPDNLKINVDPYLEQIGTENYDDDDGRDGKLPDMDTQDVTITMNPTPVFSSETLEGNLNIYNSDKNAHQIFVEIVLDDNEETIYKSGLIPVGKYLNKGKLNKSLPSGEYRCTAYFNYVSEKDNATILGKGGVKLKVTVK